MFDEGAVALEGRVVLVTGGSGFLGSALVQRLLRDHVAEIRVLTREPSPASSASHARLGQRLRSITGDLRDERVLKAAVRGAQVVFHLAAIKSIEACESNPADAISTNVLGTSALIQTVLTDSKLERFIAISSDKASRPSSVYGLTKAHMERMVAEANGVSSTDFGSIRCGSLWGSTGSVVARWQENARVGADLSVTDPEMTRFVMLPNEAVDLILEAASRRMDGSVLCRVMPAYSLGDLAALMGEMHGVKQRVTGRRPGEKLHEDLVSDFEAPFAERRGDFFTITPGFRSSGVEAFSSSQARRLTKSELRALLSSPTVSTV